MENGYVWRMPVCWEKANHNVGFYLDFFQLIANQKNSLFALLINH